MSNAGGVIGAIAAHTVITSTIRNQQAAPVDETPLTEEERRQAGHDFVSTLTKQVYWSFGIIFGIIGLIALLVWIFS